MKPTICMVVIGLLILTVCNGCLNSSLKKVDQDSLRLRINNYYKLLKNRDFEKCYHFWDTNKVGSQNEFVSYTSKSTFEILSYRIEDLRIKDQEAKATINISIRENGKRYETITADQWKVINGQWYLVDFGREEGPDTVKEFNYPEDYNKLGGPSGRP